jgi:uncharacterized membrane protein
MRSNSPADHNNGCNLVSRVPIGIQQLFTRVFFYSFWGLPLLSVFGNALLAWILLSIRVSDSAYASLQPDTCGDVPWCFILFAGTPTGARAMLNFVSSASISISTLTFSLTVLALQLAAVNYTPRILDEFLKDPMSKKALAINLGAAFYCFIVTGQIREAPDPFVPIVAVNAVIIHAAAVLVNFVFFTQYFVNNLRLESILHKASRSAWRAAELLVEEAVDDDCVVKDLPSVPPNAYRICADTSGYVADYTFSRVLRMAIELDLQVRFIPQIGQFVVEDTLVAWAWSMNENDTKLQERMQDWNGLQRDADDLTRDSISEKLGRVINCGVRLAVSRSRERDVSLGVQQLADIATRALSPGVNDPQTAVQALDSLSVVFGRLARAQLAKPVARDDDGTLRVVGPSRSFEYLLSTAMDSIRLYGSTDPSVVRRALRMLGNLGFICSRLHRPQRVDAVKQHVTAWMAAAQAAFREGSPEMLSISDVAEFVNHEIESAKSDVVERGDMSHLPDTEDLERNRPMSSDSQANSDTAAGVPKRSTSDTEVDVALQSDSNTTSGENDGDVSDSIV